MTSQQERDAFDDLKNKNNEINVEAELYKKIEQTFSLWQKHYVESIKAYDLYAKAITQLQVYNQEKFDSKNQLKFEMETEGDFRRETTEERIRAEKELQNKLNKK